MKLIIGLGNIGDKYKNTRHNIGFEILDTLAASLEPAPIKFTAHSKAPALICNLKTDHDCILAKPTTMMNLSGQAVQSLVQYYKVDLDDVWVVHDDLDIGFGNLRVRKGGSSAGNNGIKSIIQHIGAEFWRMRVGIANSYLPTTPSEKFVLDKFDIGEKKQVSTIIAKTADLIIAALKNNKLIDDTINLK